MAVNPNPSQLDPNQITQRGYDESNDAHRVIVSGATDFSIELDHEDGDSVSSFAGQLDPQSDDLLSTASPDDEIIAPFSIVGIDKVILYSQALTGVSVAGEAKLQISPLDTGNVWLDSGLSLVSSGTAGNWTVSSVTDVLARRARLVAVTAPTGGNVTYYVLTSN